MESENASYNFEVNGAAAAALAGRGGRGASRGLPGVAGQNNEIETEEFEKNEGLIEPECEAGNDIEPECKAGNGHCAAGGRAASPAAESKQDVACGFSHRSLNCSCRSMPHPP